MPLAQKLTKYTTTSPIVASYEWFDLASGNGYVSFYGMQQESSAGVTYLLNGNQLRSYGLWTQATFSTAAYTKDIDVDFDTSVITVPMTIQGDAHFNIPITVYSAGNNVASAYVIVRLKKNDVEISSVQSPTVTQTAGANTSFSAKFAMQLTAPKTVYARGDVLRVTVEVWAKATAGTAICRLFHDAFGADTVDTVLQNTVTGDLINLIPFSVDL